MSKHGSRGQQAKVMRDRPGSKAQSSAEEILDVAIVGMGPAGLYTAWRLSQSDAQLKAFGFERPAKSLRVKLYDTMSEDRVGGRLCTQPLPGYPFLAELGGMRFRSNQLLVNGLIDALGLSNQKQPFDFRQHFYFLREKRLVENYFTSDSKNDAAYELKKNERGLLPHQLIEEAIHDILKSLNFGSTWYRSREYARWDISTSEIKKKLKTKEGLHSLTAMEWAVIKRYGEYRNLHFLADVGFWDLLQFQLSSGAWHLANDGLGYESIMGNWNAAVALPWFLDDFATLKFETLQDGMRAITDRLYREIKNIDNFSVQHKFDLTGLELEENSNGGEQFIRLQFSEDGNPNPHFVLTRAVVLALPKGALIRLQLSDSLVEKASIPANAPEGFDRRLWFSDLLHSVDGRALFKLFLGYSSPWWTKTKWWREAGMKPSAIHGKVNTDLPLRQVYYYGKEQWNETRRKALGLSPKKDHHSMLMASYSDSHYIEFWSELKKDPSWRYRGLKRKLKLSREDKRAHDEFGAPLTMIIRAEHQLEILHGKRILKSKEEPQAEIGLYMEWSRPPYYAGWHSWKVGVKPWEICSDIMRPFGNAKVYICGEAYSNEQGWVEGALKSSERLLTLVFGLPLPSEMLKGKFGGDRDKLLDYIDALDEKDRIERVA